jgi:hypothetical protein
MSASSTEKLPPPHSRFATTRFILLLPSKGTRKTKIAKRGFGATSEMSSKFHPKFFALKVRSDGSQASIFVRTFRSFTIDLK